jgi:hypothetical protein
MGLLLFIELLNIMGSAPVHSLAYWASALRTQIVLDRSTNPLGKDSPAHLNFLKLKAIEEKKRRIARRAAPKRTHPPFEPPFTNILPRISGWIRALAQSKAKLPVTPGLAFSIRTVNATGMASPKESWTATIVIIYEHKTGSLFHCVPTKNTDAPFSELQLWIYVEKAIKILKKKSRYFPTVPAALLNANRTLFLPLSEDQLQLANVYDRAQQQLNEHRDTGKKLCIQNTKGKLVHLEPNDWQIIRTKASAAQTHVFPQNTKDALARALARHAHSCTTKLRQFHRKNTDCHEGAAENCNQVGQNPNQKPGSTPPSKQPASPDYLRFSWRALFRIR